jgi:hypothetical protein
MTSSVRGQVTLQAIKCLRKSGEKSFEKLTATLLSLLIGFPIRLCKSKSDHTILVHTPCRAPNLTGPLANLTVPILSVMFGVFSSCMEFPEA